MQERAFSTPGAQGKPGAALAGDAPAALLQRLAGTVFGWRSASSWGFWLLWALAPGLQVALHALLFWPMHPVLATYAAVLGCLLTASEAWALFVLLSRCRLGPPTRTCPPRVCFLLFAQGRPPIL